jgi:hypothetical protein
VGSIELDLDRIPGSQLRRSLPRDGLWLADPDGEVPVGFAGDEITRVPLVLVRAVPGTCAETLLPRTSSICSVLVALIRGSG